MEGLLALDVGLKKTGVAKMVGGLPFPAGTLLGGRDAQWKAFLTLNKDLHGKTMVLGFPQTHDGGVTELHGRLLWWETRLKGIGLEVHWVREGFSTHEAQTLMREAGLSANQEDAIAAVVLLQRFCSQKE